MCRAAPCLVLAQQEGQQHQHPPVVDDPPDVDVALCAGLAVAGEQGDVFGDQQGQVGCCGHPHCVWMEERGRYYTGHTEATFLFLFLVKLSVVSHLLMKVFQAWGSSLCLQA